MVVNDDAGSLIYRGGLRIISRASPLLQVLLLRQPQITVGASLLAMVVNDDAGSLIHRGGLRII